MSKREEKLSRQDPGRARIVLKIRILDKLDTQSVEDKDMISRWV